MKSKFFEIKTSEDKFEERLDSLSQELCGKRILALGTYENLKKLNKKFKISNKFNFVCLATKRKKFTIKSFDIRIIDIKEIEKEKFDYILIINPSVIKLTNYLLYDLSIDSDKIKALFEEKYKDESENLDFLYQFKFNKTLPKLINKLKNKRVVLYGAGLLLEVINKYFDISDLNIIAIADMKFENHEFGKQFMNYDVCSPNEIKDLNPDYVLVATKFYVNTIEDLYYKNLKNTKIKIKPFVKKDFFTLLKEI